MPKSTDKRLLYLDILRGFFILYIVWLHAFNAVVFGNNPDAAGQVNPLVFALLAPLVVLATWAPIFAMISGTAHAYVIHRTVTRRLADGVPEDRAFRGILRGAAVNSLCLYGFSLVNMIFLHHAFAFNGAFRYTLLTSTLQDGFVHPYSGQLLFYNDALALIAMNGLAVTVLLWLLWRKGGIAHPRRNRAFMAGIIVTWIVASPALHQWLDTPFYAALDAGRYGTAGLLKFVIGPNQSPFPNIAYGLIGAMMGLAIAQDLPIRRIRPFAYVSGFGLLLAGLGIIAFRGLAVSELARHTFPIKMHLVNMGLMLCLSTFLLDKVEMQSPERREIWVRRTRFLRRFSTAALSVFLLEGAVSVLLGKLYVLPWDMNGVFPRTPWAVIPYIALLIALWHGLLCLWERWNFKYGAEWWLIQIVGAVRGRKSRRLETRYVAQRPVFNMED